ncbi:MAG: HD domain-containing phosphohydrolase [bacterium]
METLNTITKTGVDLEERIRKLNAIGIALSSEQNLNNLLELIVSEARHFTNADGGSLYIKEEDRLNFVVAQTESLQRLNGHDHAFTSFYLPLTKESIAGYVAITGEPLNIQDVYQLPPDVEYRVNKQFDINSGYRSQSMLVVPMRDHHDEIIGVLQLINSLDGKGTVVPFHPDFEDLILSLASQAAVAIRNVKLIEEIKNLFRSLVRYSAKAIDARSPHTAGHSGRVAKYSVLIAQAINEETEGKLGQIHFTTEELEELRMAGWLHDIGKIGVPESILEKTAKLTDDQLALIEERFETIKNQKKIQFLENRISKLSQDQFSTSDLPEWQTKLHQELAFLDEALAFIRDKNQPGYLSADDIFRLKNLAEKTYFNSQGEVCHYLTNKEFENLSIIKGNLTESEYREIQSHVEYSLEILNKIPFTRELQNIPKHTAAHHEYLNGTGYPRGLKGDEITYQARIMCIADIFDALSSPDRPYKQATSLEKTLDILRQEVRAGKLDGDIVELFIRKKIYEHRSTRDDEE